jgi:hypothetical protein
MSLSSTHAEDEFDYFPHMNHASYGASEHAIVQSLKQGTYQPHMQMVEYSAVVKGKNKTLVSAEPKIHEFIGATKDTWEEYSADMIRQQTRNQSKTRTEVLNEQFQNSNIPLRPRYYHNPLQYFDHVLLSDAYVNSFGGTVVDTYSDFIMPKTIKPVLRLRNPKKIGDKKKQEEYIKKNQAIVDKLEAVDNWYSDLGREAQDPLIDIPLHQKFRALLTNTINFGRDAMIFENWKHIDPVTVDGEEYKGLPNTIKLMHPIDMGMIEIDEYTWKLAGMYVHNDRAYIPSNQMLYLVNRFQSPMIGSMMYGFSLIQRAIDPIRLIRRILARNYQQFIRNSASGMGMFIFDSSQYPQDVRTKIRTAIKNSYQAGEIGVIDYANIKDFVFQEMKINTDIAGLQQLQESLIKVIIGVTGIPQSLIFDESAATRATLVGRIVSFLNNQVTTLRTTMGQLIAAQWYNRVFRTVYEKQDDILDTFYIDVEFEEMELETKLEKVARLLQETQLNQYTNEYIGEELGDKEYLEHIDEKKNQEKMMQSPSKNVFGNKGQFSVTDSSTGQSVNVSKASA